STRLGEHRAADTQTCVASGDCGAQGRALVAFCRRESLERIFRTIVRSCGVERDRISDGKSVSMQLTNLTDVQLLDSLMTVCGQGRLVLARLLAHLGEVEERRLHLEAACPSMFEFCVRKLGMSDGEACRRLTAARLARRFPDLLLRIERGQITLS